MAKTEQDSTLASVPGTDIQERVEQTGSALSESLNAVLTSLPGAPLGPQKLANLLGQSIVLTSRLLKATGSSEPVAVVHHVPGPDPLRRLLRAAAKKGADTDAIRAAKRATNDLEALIRDEVGDRGALNAIISAWLPEARRAFELRRRQSAFKAMSELRGAACSVDFTTLLLHPSSEGEHIDIVVLQGAFGLNRMRPGVTVKFGTRRMSSESNPRCPTNLDGHPTVDGLDRSRLDQFCFAPPAPLEVLRYGDIVRLMLGDSGYGPRSGVDIVLGEVNLAEIPIATGDRMRFFYHLLALPARKLLFDLFVHEDLYVGLTPELVVHDTAMEGEADVNDPTRDVDRVDVSEEIQLLGTGTERLRVAEIPRYVELVKHAYDKLGFDPRQFRGYRCQMDYPVYGTQTSMVFPPTGS